MVKTNNKIYKVGIVGYGVVGSKRRIFIDQHPNLQTVAVCDVRFKKDSTMIYNQSASESYEFLESQSVNKVIAGTFEDGIHFCNNYRYFLENYSFDILFVCLPNYLAPELSIAGLEKGMHVFCEKPPGRTVDDIKNVIHVENKHPGLILKYGFNHRYHKSVQKALELVSSGELGEIIHMRGVYGKSKVVSSLGQWRSERKFSGGGILLDQGIHMVDLMRLFCGEFEKVKSFISDDFYNLDVEDNAFALMKNTKGQIAVLHSSATQWQHRFALEIYLSKGYIILNGIITGSKSYGEEKLIIGRRKESDTGGDSEEVFTYLDDNSWSAEINEFAHAICNNKKIKYGTSKDALETMKTVYRIYWADPEWRRKYKIKNPN